MKPRQRGIVTEVKKHWILFVMLIPAFVFFMINSYIPMVGIYYAFTNFNYSAGLFGSPFVGLSNFTYLFKSNVLLNATKNTVLYNLIFMFVGTGLQIAVAILLSQMMGRWFKKIAQSIILFPYFVSYVIVGTLAYNLLNNEYGVLNSTLKSLGMATVNVYGSNTLMPVVITVLFLWKGLGYGTVIYLAAIMGIGQEFYEAANIDGANVFQKIRYITLPLLKPTFITLLLFSLGGIMRGQFDLFYQIVGRNGLLFQSTDIIDTFVYRSLTVGFDIGMGTAAGLYQSVFGFLLILTINYLVKRKNPEYALF